MTTAIRNGCKNDRDFREISLPLQALTLCWTRGRLPSLFAFPPLPIPCPQEFPSSSVENTRGINFLRRCSAPFACPLCTMLRKALRLTNTSLFSRSLTVSCGAYKKTDFLGYAKGPIRAFANGITFTKWISKIQVAKLDTVFCAIRWFWDLLGYLIG